MTFTFDTIMMPFSLQQPTSQNYQIPRIFKGYEKSDNNSHYTCFLVQNNIAALCLLVTCCTYTFISRHDNFTGRWLSTFHARWDPKTSTCFGVGSMKNPRQVSLNKPITSTLAIFYANLANKCDLKSA